MEQLSDGLLENVLLRLPLVDLPTGKQVCKHWKRLIESIGFRRAYKTKPVALLQLSRVTFLNLGPCYLFVDRGSNTTLWSGRRFRFGSITSHINGLLIARSHSTGKICIGNPFINKWEELEGIKDVLKDEVGIFPLENGRFQLVFWNRHNAGIFTLAAGQPEWYVAKPPEHSVPAEAYTNVVVMSDRDHVMFRVRRSDGMLMEYNTISGKFSSTRITNADKEKKLEFYHPFPQSQSARLLALQGMLYLLKVDDRFLEGIRLSVKTVEIWRISPDDASATFVRLIEREWNDFTICEVDGLIRFQWFSGNGNTVNQLLYNTATNTLQRSQFNSHTLWIEEKVAVRLEFDRFL